ALPEGLWTASGTSGAILRLAPEQLDGTGDRSPSTAITTPSALLPNLVGVTFDRDGTMWVVSRDDSLLLAFAPGALAGSGATPASTIIAPNAGSLSGPTALAFDRSHRLWVANFDNGTVVRFNRDQLAASGSPKPAIVLTRLGHPTAIAFDAAGGLWVSDIQAQTVTGFPASELATSDDPISSVVLHRGADSLDMPTGIAFDASGNLWIANIGNETLVAFTPAQLAAAGSPAPHVVLHTTGGSLTFPVGVAFDAEGSLWVLNRSGTLVKFARAGLGTPGTPATGARLILSGYARFWSVAFWPRPPGLPLN
ncbi:MAG: hypothetical protein ABI742_11565, partial [Gemmatimonadota bacterium]